MTDFKLENELIQQLQHSISATLPRDYIIVGVDEVGYGTLAGPVVASAVYFPQRDKTIIIGINDSKKLTPKKRERLFVEITNHAKYATGFANVTEIDKYNVLVASHLAMKRALINLNLPIDCVLVDGHRLPNLPWPAKAIVNGDNISTSIAAASIIAKVIRDRLMQKIHTEYPQYYWNENKGYGTKKHLDALNKHGPSLHHRYSFAPVLKAQENQVLINKTLDKLNTL